MSTTTTLIAPTDEPNVKIVEGSDGLLLEIDGQIVPNYDATMHPFQEGDVVTGNVVRIDNDEVLVDIGYKSEGVIPASELSIRKSVDPSDEVELGEEVDALVLTKEDQDGRLILSKKRARFEKAWRRIEAAAESGEPVEGAVIEVVKGGLIIDLGVRGFLPASLVDIRRVPNLDEYMGQSIECKVIELNRSRNNVVLSRRAVLEEQRKEDRERILDRLQPGQVVEGTISNIVDFGAFVDLDGIDGLIHISELSWSHVNHPSEILSIGDTVSVKVLDIDRHRQRISLGLKQTQEDPWQRVVDTYNIGDELEGNVTKVVTFGAFVEILDGVEGLVHISELAQHHVENPREIIQPGDPVRVKILEIDSERRRLSLSIKRVEGQVLPVRPIVPPAEGDGTDLDDVPELGLSEDVFVDSAGADSPAAVQEPGDVAGADALAESPAAAAVDVAVGDGSDRVEPASVQPEAVAAPETVAEPEAVAALEADPAPAPEADAPAPAPEAQAAAPAPEAQAAAPTPQADAEAPTSAPEAQAAAPTPQADAEAPTSAPEAQAAAPAPEADAEAPAPAPEVVPQAAEPASADSAM
jgi:small subunit ribosomal protein S1